MGAALWLQVFTSFVIGGCLITFLSLLAERASERVAGILMMFPSTIVLGFFFLGLSTSASKVAEIAPATLTPLGLVIFSSVIYIYAASFIGRYISHKPLQIAATFISSALIWFILAAPFAIYRISNFSLGTIGYLLLAGMAYIILNKQKTASIPRHSYTKMQVLFRAGFVGAIIAVVVLLGKILNPFWGGVFTMFPAATFATLITFHYYYSPGQLSYFMKKAPLGSISLFGYILSCMWLFPIFGIVWGTLLCYSICLCISLLLMRLTRAQKTL